MKHARPGIVALAALAATACSTTHVQPEITAFTKTVEATAASSEKAFDERRLQERLAQARRESMVEQGAFYMLEGPCRPVRPSTLVDFADPKASDFTVNCRLARRVGPELRDFDQALPESDVVREHNARRAIRALGRYAVALGDLARAETAEEVAKAAADSVTALHTLGTALGEVGKEAGGSPDTQRIVGAGTGLLSSIVKESLEARRHAVLAAVVSEADPTVRDLSQAAAVWYYRQEADALQASYEQLEELADRSIGGSAADQEALENAYDELARRSGNAKWRVFAQIAQAHASILAALERPLDVARLAEANGRISELVTRTQAFLGTLDAANGT